MSTITALTTQVKNADRVSVFLDGEFVCGLALEVAVGLRAVSYTHLTLPTSDLV